MTLQELIALNDDIVALSRARIPIGAALLGTSHNLPIMTSQDASEPNGRLRLNGEIRMKRNTRRRSSGFTLVELLVVIAIIGILVAMMLPAVSSARETARRLQCEANLSNVALAFISYHDAQVHFPAGVTNPSGPIRNEAKGIHHSWTISLLPFLDEAVVYDQIKDGTSVYDPSLESLRNRRIPVLACPSSPMTGGNSAYSDYAGVHHSKKSQIAEDNDGTLFLNSQIAAADILDGLQYTILVGEKLSDSVSPDLGWMSGTPATLRNSGWELNTLDTPKQEAGNESNDPATVVGGFGSHHSAGGAQFLYANGTVSYLAGVVDIDLLQQLANRSDGSLIDAENLD